MSDLVPLALLAFIAWRERQHALERAALSRKGVGKTPSPVVSSRRRGKPGPARVISSEDDAAFLEKKGRAGAVDGEAED